MENGYKTETRNKAKINYDNRNFQSVCPSSVREEIESLCEADIGRPNAYILFSPSTPYIFRLLSLPDLPVIAYRDKLARALFLDETKRHGHSSGISKEIIVQTAETLADPLYVFKSATRNNSIVSIHSVLDKQNNPMMISLSTKLGATQNIEVNLISSIYGRPVQQLQNWIEKGLLIYWNDLNDSKAALSVRLQLPSDVTASIHNILVKSRICQQNAKHIEYTSNTQ